MPDASMTERIREVADREVPGIAVAIAGPEGLRETAAAGYADLADGEPASADMVCPWVSMTKIVTATLACDSPAGVCRTWTSPSCRWSRSWR